jgi:hypothetical protein
MLAVIKHPGRDAFLTKPDSRLRRAANNGVRQIPIWKDVISGSKKPAEVRADSIVGYGVGWQAITKAAAAVISAFPDSWEAEIKAVLSKIEWHQSNPDWQDTCMIGKRVNNTGPAVKATAGYILQKGGVPDAKNPYLQNYLDSKTSALEAKQAAE